MPVLVDPSDEGWIRLVAEPADPTFWLTGGLCALLLAALFYRREDAAIRWRRWAAGRDLPARKVLVDSDGLTTYLHAIGSGRDDPPFASLSTEPVPWPGRPNPYDLEGPENPGGADTGMDDELGCQRCAPDRPPLPWNVVERHSSRNVAEVDREEGRGEGTRDALRCFRRRQRR